MRREYGQELAALGRDGPRCRARVRSLQTGVTLIELLVVVAIAAILAVITVPSFSGFINSTRQSSAAAQLVSDLNLARSEAIKRNARMLVCSSNAAATDCSGSKDWKGGWLVCIEDSVTPAPNQCAAGSSANPNPIAVRPALANALTLAFSNPITTSATTVRFNPSSSQGSDGAAVTLTLGGTWSGAVSRVITVATTGHISKQ